MSDFINARLDRLEESLSRIESHLGTKPAIIAASPIPAQTPAAVPAEIVRQDLIADLNEDLDSWANDGFIPSPRSYKETVTASEETRSSTNWLGIAAIFCFVLAAGLIIKLSIDSGWLTPVRQIGISALLGLSLIASGLAFLKLDRAYASLLPSAGIIILYVTAFAAHRYYEVISFETAIVLTSLVSALCVGLYNKIKHDIYALTAAVGVYVSPHILGLHASTDFTLSYFLLCSVAFASISIFLQSRLLILVPANLAILMTVITGQDIAQNEFVASCLGINFLIFSISTYLYSRYHEKPLTENEAWCFFPVLFIFYASEYSYLFKINPDIAPWISLGFSGVLMGLYLSARKLFPEGLGSQNLILCFTTVVLFHSAYIQLLPDDFKPWLLVLIILTAAFVPSENLLKKPQGGFIIPFIAIGAIAALEYLKIIIHLFETHDTSWALASLAVVASTWTLIIKKYDIVRAKTDVYYALLGSTHFLAILGLYRFATESGSLAVSASWLLYAVIVMFLFATPRKDAVMAKSALAVLALAAGKALLYDASNAPSLVRIFCLLLTGAVLYGCGFLMRKVATWKTTA